MTTKFYVKTSLNIYTCVVKVSKDHSQFELDVYDADISYNDRPKYLHEGQWIGGYEDMEFLNPTQPIELAKKIIDAWERPQRLEKYLRLKNYFIHINEKESAPAKETPSKPIIVDYQEKAHSEYISTLIEKPELVEEIPKKERDKLLKENADLRARFQQWLWLEKC